MQNQQAETFDLAIYAGRVVTMNPAREVLDNTWVGITEDRIAYIGSNPIQAKTTHRLEDGILIPGLINTHTHAPMTILRAMADDIPILEWITQYNLPTEQQFVSDDFTYLGTQLGCMEMLASGTTTFCEMFYNAVGIGRAAVDNGMRCYLSVVPAQHHLQKLAFEQQFLQGKQILQDCLATFADQSRIKIMLGPHSPYLMPPEAIQETIALAKKHNIPLNMHIAESQGEINLTQYNYGVEVPTIVQYLDRLGFFDHNVLGVHMVWANADDIDILAAKDVRIAHCPQSNLKLGSGIAPIKDMLEAGIKVSVATDGPASNNNMDLWEEMTLAAFLHKGVNHDPTVLPAQKAFEMVTIDAAACLWMQDEIGSIEIGKKADLALIDTQVPHQIPASPNVYAQLVYAAKSSDVQKVWVDGVCLKDGRHFPTINQEQVFAKVKTIRKDVDAFLQTLQK